MYIDTCIYVTYINTYIHIYYMYMYILYIHIYINTHILPGKEFN